MRPCCAAVLPAVLFASSFALSSLALPSLAWADGLPDGAKIFDRNCSICHSIDVGQNRTGPSLAGVVGRPAGQVAGYAYSDANRKSGIVWDQATLDTYLADPRGLVPGTKMTFPGLKDPVARAAIIGYLKSRGSSGSSTPPS